MEEGVEHLKDVDAKGLKLAQKFAKLWKKIVRSDASCRYSPLNSETWPRPADCTHRDSNCGPLHPASLPATPVCGPLRPGGGNNCFNRIMPSRKWHISRSLPSSQQHLSFSERQERLEQVKGKIKELVNFNNNCAPKDVPKGFVAVYVGDEQEEQTRFVIPVLYLNHPLFLQLLKEAEQVYGFDQKGVFTLPCQVSDFEYRRWLIEREQKLTP